MGWADTNICRQHNVRQNDTTKKWHISQFCCFIVKTALFWLFSVFFMMILVHNLASVNIVSNLPYPTLSCCYSDKVCWITCLSVIWSGGKFVQYWHLHIYLIYTYIDVGNNVVILFIYQLWRLVEGGRGSANGLVPCQCEGLDHAV